jgi:prephenate dehydratase
MKTTGLSLGALGGPHTFNGKAATSLCEAYPLFGEIHYFPTSDDVLDAALRGKADAACAPEQMSLNGFHSGMLAKMVAPDSKLNIIAEVSRFYDCSLLAKPGADLRQLRMVFGHNGSIAHSRAWLESTLPWAKIEIVDTHSDVAARAVLDSDGSIASVGSPDLAHQHGLVQLASRIDGGAAVNYWAVSLLTVFDERPDRLLIVGRFGDDTRLSRLIEGLMSAGFAIRTACPKPSGRALYEYDYMLRFAGNGSLSAVRDVLAKFSDLRLAGAWTVRNP